MLNWLINLFFFSPLVWGFLPLQTFSLLPLVILGSECVMIVPAGWPDASSCVTCPCELGHLRSAPSVSTWKEMNKGEPSRPFALRRSSQLARNIKGTHLRIGTPWLDVLKVVQKLDNWTTSSFLPLTACAYSGCANKTTRVSLCVLKLKTLIPVSNV